MAVILNKYRDDEYMVIKDDVLKCKHMTEDKARAFASRLSGNQDYVDETKRAKKKSKSKE